MPDIGIYNKTIVAVLMGVLGIIEQFTEVTIDGVRERWVTTAIFVVLAILVWAVPNHPASAKPPPVGINPT